LLAALAIAATALLLVVLLRAAPLAAAQATQGSQAAAQKVSDSASSSQERWLHVSVTSSDQKGERVRVNVPISLARNVLGSIQHGKLDHGIVHISDARMDDIDLRQMLKAVKAAQEGEYVTVEQRDCNVRVSKQNGILLVNVVDKAAGSSTGKNHAQNVDVRMPIAVAEALFSGAQDELNVTAALEALARHGDMELVAVRDAENFVRIWVDTKNTSD
jgi:hypothetical protein